MDVSIAVEEAETRRRTQPLRNRVRAAEYAVQGAFRRCEIGVDPSLYRVRPLGSRRVLEEAPLSLCHESFWPSSLCGGVEEKDWSGVCALEVDAPLDAEEAALEAMGAGDATRSLAGGGALRSGPAAPGDALQGMVGAGPGRPMIPVSLGRVSGHGGDAMSMSRDLRVLEGHGIGSNAGFDASDASLLDKGLPGERVLSDAQLHDLQMCAAVDREGKLLDVFLDEEDDDDVDSEQLRPGDVPVRVNRWDEKPASVIERLEHIMAESLERSTGTRSGVAPVEEKVEEEEVEEEKEEYFGEGRNPGNLLDIGRSLAKDDTAIREAQRRIQERQQEERNKAANAARMEFDAAIGGETSAEVSTNEISMERILRNLGEEEANISKKVGWMPKTNHSSSIRSKSSSNSYGDTAPSGPSELWEESIAGDFDDLLFDFADEIDHSPLRKPTQTTATDTPGSQTPSSIAPFALLDEEEMKKDEQELPTSSRSKEPQWAVTRVLTEEELALGEARRGRNAVEFPFQLDSFQRQAVHWMEEGENVFVAAHTSAGKTVVAEYAVALCQNHGSRCVYCSPIKALSNQKYRDFRDRFEDVGLVTGDVSVNPEASCLIMTTEILRSMLYRGADLIRDIEWVVFDEVHYVNDAERGVVWEETIIMLPDHVSMVFLSATSPNTAEFSEWIGRTKRRRVHVIATDKRPVPLMHSIWTGGRVFPILDAARRFSAEGHRAATEWGENRVDIYRKGPPESAKKRGKIDRAKERARQAQPGRPGGDRQQWTSLVDYLNKNDMLPGIVFSFSKRKCEEVAAGMLSSVMLNTSRERQAAQHFLARSVARLSPKDRDLPQVHRMRDLVGRGVGVHHGGILPILKECVELLFSKGLVKLLFATETFAMGVNMPARTVVFNGIRKHDGSGFRWLEPGEYTQMAGRAGRRGIDSVGHVLLPSWSDVVPGAPLLRHMLLGKPRPLASRFRLTYRMLLSLLRIEELSITDVMRRSFSEFRTQRMLAGRDFHALLARGQARLRNLDRIARENAPCLYLETHGLDETKPIGSFYDASAVTADAFHSFAQRLLLDPRARATAMTPGRLVVLQRPKELEGDTPLASQTLFLAATLDLTGSDLTALVIADRKSFEPPQKDEPTNAVLWESPLVNGRTAVVIKTSTDTVVRIVGSRIRVPPGPAVLEHLSSSTDAGGNGAGGVGGGGAKESVLDTDEFAGLKVMGKKKSKILGGGGMVPSKSKKSSSKKSSSKKSSSASSDSAKSMTRPQLVTALESASRLLIEELARWEAEYVANRPDWTGRVSATRGWHRSLPPLPPLDPREVLRARDADVDLVQEAERAALAQMEVESSPCAHCPRLPSQWALEARRRRLRKQIAELRSRVSAQGLQLFPDLMQRLQVLRTLGYVTQDDDTDDVDDISMGAVVAIKGRVACEIGTTEELILVEAIFEGILHPLSPEEAAALLSAFVCQERSDGAPTLPPRLDSAKQHVIAIAEAIGAIQMHAGLDSIPAEFARNSLNFTLAQVVHAWASGASFTDAAALAPDVPEGGIVRTVTRLDECIRSVRNAARVIGDPVLFRKMEGASAAIRRDVIFAASLYVN